MTATAPEDAPGPEAPDHGLGFWIAVVVGGALMAWGGYLFLDATAAVDRRLNFVGYLVGAGVVHDLVVAPVVCGVGLLTARLVPGRARAPVQAGFIASGAVLVVVVFMFAGCAVAFDAADTLLTARDRVTARTVQNTVAGAERYCRFFGADRRALFRAQTDRGKGPIVEIHCERLSWSQGEKGSR